MCPSNGTKMKFFINDIFSKCDQFINLVFVVMIHVSTSFYLLSIPYTKLLMLTLHLIQEVSFWICPKLLTKFGMKG